MKLMRSRFRLIALLLACGFLLTAVLCAASVLKQEGFDFSSAWPLLTVSDSPAPDASPAGAEADPAGTEADPAPSGKSDPENLTEKVTIQPDSEYNIAGL